MIFFTWSTTQVVTGTAGGGGGLGFGGGVGGVGGDGGVGEGGGGGDGGGDGGIGGGSGPIATGWMLHALGNGLCPAPGAPPAPH